MKKLTKQYQTLILFCLGFGIISIIKYIITGSGIPCFFSYITKLSCPGCGISRMFISILKLDFYQAFRYNPLVFLLLIITIIAMATLFIIYKLTNKKIKIPNSLYYVLIVVVIVYGIMRNMPQFSYLLPTVIN